MKEHCVFENEHIFELCDGSHHRIFYNHEGFKVLAYCEPCSCVPRKPNMIELYEQANLQSQIDDLAWIARLRTEIKYLEGRYHFRMAQKEYKSADKILEIVNLYKKDLKEYEDAVFTKDGGSKISETLPGGGKTVFVLKR